jgi:diguanylate cyclase (GGDEF)-like protein
VLQNAVAIAERLRTRISEIDPGKADDLQLPPVSVSIGIAEFKSGDSLEDLIADADAAMYAAKHAGRNCVRITTQA